MIITDEKKKEIKTAADIVEVIGEYVSLKKNGKDHLGLCPFHFEKTPSFTVSYEKQMFYCFGCGVGGDVFEFLEKKEGIPFPEAVIRIAEKTGHRISDIEYRKNENQTSHIAHRTSTKKEEYVPSVPSVTQAPGEIWQEKATKLVEWSHETLLKNDKRLAWLEERGIGIDLVKEFKLGWNIGENGKGICRPRESWGLAPEYKEDKKTKKVLWMPIGYVIPFMMENKVLRIRFRPDSGKSKYILLSGSSSREMVLGAHASRAYVIIETELDAIMVWGKVRKNKIGVVGLGTAQKHLEIETYELLKKTPVILNALDYDKAGNDAVYGWWKKRFSPDNHKHWPVREGKDPGDAYKAGIDIANWIRLGLPEAWNWEVKGERIQGFGVQVKSRNQKPETGFAAETFGRSDLLNDDLKEAEVSFLEEFVALVKNSPQVTIHVSPGRLKIDELPAWSRAFPERSKRLSELVFLNMEVRSFLMGLGEAEVNTRNIEGLVK